MLVNFFNLGVCRLLNSWLNIELNLWLNLFINHKFTTNAISRHFTIATVKNNKIWRGRIDCIIPFQFLENELKFSWFCSLFWGEVSWLCSHPSSWGSMWLSLTRGRRGEALLQAEPALTHLQSLFLFSSSSAWRSSKSAAVVVFC